MTSTRNFRPEHERAAIARAFSTSGITQREYAARHRVSDRTLREWLRRWSQAPVADVRNDARRIIEQAVRQLQGLLRDLDTERNFRVEEESTEHNPMPPPMPGVPMFLTRSGS